jgi:hypothetical protein
LVEVKRARAEGQWKPGVKLKAKPQSIAGEDLNASNDE